MRAYEFKRAMLDAGWTREEVVAQWGLNPRTLREWEMREGPLPKAAVDIAAYLHKTAARAKVAQTTTEGLFSEGTRFGRLVVDCLHSSSYSSRSGRQALVTCDCGETFLLPLAKLRTKRQCGSKCELAGRPMPPCTRAEDDIPES